MSGFPYFYDQQIRRILIQFGRVLEGFKVKTDDSKIIKVPVMYGDGSRQVAHILKNNSENTVLSVPRISYYISNVGFANERRGYAGNMNTNLVTERKFDHDTNTYTDQLGTQYHVDTLYPNPIDLTISVDIWVSNTHQKLQLFEQIYLLFNPALDLQTTKNPLDWTAINLIELLDVTWTNNNIPKGSEDNIEVMSMSFMIKGWVNPPARVKKQTLINTIIQRIGSDIDGAGGIIGFGDDEEGVYSIVTPGNHTVRLNGSNIILLGPNGETIDPSTEDPYSWSQLIDQYGELKDSHSKIKLRWNGVLEDETLDTIGYISYNNSDPNLLVYTPIEETTPQTTLTDIIGVINPHESYPGGSLPTAANGQRYLITEPIGPDSEIWGALTADIGDIITFSSGSWSRTTDVSSISTAQIVRNSTNGKYYRLVNHIWIEFYNQKYAAGYFRILL